MARTIVWGEVLGEIKCVLKEIASCFRSHDLVGEIGKGSQKKVIKGC